MRASVLQVRDVRSGQLFGTIELVAGDELRVQPPELLELLTQTMATRGLSSAEVFAWYTGWSNGYVEIVPVQEA
ncbi:hypothetical protein Misp01_57800 [Microtetraspora sp. NBRC 13810]|uniref:hypothetical protein n=1 Tax=Microtetraspora sp. NBRC 13810 TaxID=3030990 RepID=UPI0024A5A518|nr:hypothetical protein [Microtetraspora sp. NBRC 13810]GLW10652.1 hypothetical protein Misp01_57800 [Microtetraspora sp. NBRC 13810]